MASIYLKPDSPYYQIRYYDKHEDEVKKRRKTFSTKIQVTPSDLKRQKVGQKLLGTPELKKLKKSFEEALFERNLYSKTKIKIKKNITFTDGFEEFISSKPNLAKSTIRLYKLSASYLLKSCGDKEIISYNHKDYVKLYEHVVQQTRTSMAIYFRHLHSLFGFFVKKHYILENIIIKINPTKTDPEPIPYDDMQVILEYFESKNFWHYSLVYFLLLTGMRESSAMIQKRKDIDLQARVIKAINVKAKHRTFYFPISDELQDLLALIYEKSDLRKDRLFYTFPDTGFGLKFWSRGIKDLMKLKKLNTKYVMKQLRKTFPSWLASAGVERGIVKDLMDHSNVLVTEQHYLKIEAQHYLSEVSKVRFKKEKTVSIS